MGARHGEPAHHPSSVVTTRPEWARGFVTPPAAAPVPSDPDEHAYARGSAAWVHEGRARRGDRSRREAARAPAVGGGDPCRRGSSSPGFARADRHHRGPLGRAEGGAAPRPGEAVRVGTTKGGPQPAGHGPERPQTARGGPHRPPLHTGPPTCPKWVSNLPWLSTTAPSCLSDTQPRPVRNRPIPYRAERRRVTAYGRPGADGRRRRWRACQGSPSAPVPKRAGAGRVDAHGRHPFGGRYDAMACQGSPG